MKGVLKMSNETIYVNYTKDGKVLITEDLFGHMKKFLKDCRESIVHYDNDVQKSTLCGIIRELSHRRCHAMGKYIKRRVKLAENISTEMTYNARINERTFHKSRDGNEYVIQFKESISIQGEEIWRNEQTKKLFYESSNDMLTLDYPILYQFFVGESTNPELNWVCEHLLDCHRKNVSQSSLFYVGPERLCLTNSNNEIASCEYGCTYDDIDNSGCSLLSCGELYLEDDVKYTSSGTIGFHKDKVEFTDETKTLINDEIHQLVDFNKPEKKPVEVACTKDGKIIITKELLDQLKSCLVKLREMYSYDAHNPDNDQTFNKYGQVAIIDHAFSEPVVYSVFMDEPYIVRDSEAGYYKISFKERLLVGSKEVWTNMGQKTLMHFDTTNFSKNKKNAIYEYFTSHTSNDQQRNIFDIVVDNYKKTAISTDYESPFFYTGMPIIGMTEPSETNNGASFYSCRYVSSPEESSSPYSMRSDGVLTFDGELKYKSVNVMEFNDKNIVFDDEAKESISCEMDSLKTEVIKSRGKGNIKEQEKKIAKITACEAPTDVLKCLGPFSLSIIQTLAYGIKPNEIELEKDDENGIYIINVVRRANPNSIHSDVCNPYSICITPTFIAGIGVCIDKKTRRKMIHIIKSTYDFGNCTMHHRVWLNDKIYDCLPHDSLASTIESKFTDYLRIYFCPLKGWANRTDADIINNTSNTRPIEELAAISEVLKSERSETRNTIRLYNMFWENYSECMIKAGLPEPFDYEKDLEEHRKHDSDLKKRVINELIQSGEV